MEDHHTTLHNPPSLPSRKIDMIYSIPHIIRFAYVTLSQSKQTVQEQDWSCREKKVVLNMLCLNLEREEYT